MENDAKKLESIIETWYWLADLIDPNRFSAWYVDTSNRDESAWKSQVIEIDTHGEEEGMPAGYYRVNESDNYYFEVRFYDDGPELCNWVIIENENGEEEMKSIDQLQGDLDMLD